MPLALRQDDDGLGVGAPDAEENTTTVATPSKSKKRSQDEKAFETHKRMKEADSAKKDKHKDKKTKKDAAKKDKHKAKASVYTFGDTADPAEPFVHGEIHEHFWRQHFEDWACNGAFYWTIGAGGPLVAAAQSEVSTTGFAINEAHADYVTKTVDASFANLFQKNAANNALHCPLTVLVFLFFPGMVRSNSYLPFFSRGVAPPRSLARADGRGNHFLHIVFFKLV